MAPGALRSGSRVAVVGGGLAGFASALAVTQAARLRGVKLEVELFAPSPSPKLRPPVLLTPECRARLATLGCSVPGRSHLQGVVELDIHSGRGQTTVSLPQGGAWLFEDAATGRSGRDLLLDALREAALKADVHVRPARVTAVTHEDVLTDGAAPWVVAANGKHQRFTGVLFAPGICQGATESVLRGFRPAPSLPAVLGRLKVPDGEWMAATRLWLSPLPGVDALAFVPTGLNWFAYAFGPSCGPADFCEALMRAAREGLLPEGFELLELEPTRVPAGAARRLMDDGRIVVGSAAMGHPLAPLLRDMLLCAHRAATTLVLTGAGAELGWNLENEDFSELREDAVSCVRALRWLRRAGPHGSMAFARARRSSPLRGGPQGLWGGETPTAQGLESSARGAAIRAWFERWTRWPSEERRPATHQPVEQRLVYVVEDDEGLRTALARGLESRGAEVVCFADELALLASVARRPPHTVLLDVVLNRVDGLRICASLKNHPSSADTHVFVMSGLDRPHIRARAKESGADGFFPKPLDLDRLWRRITGHAATETSHFAENVSGGSDSLEGLRSA